VCVRVREDGRVVFVAGGFGSVRRRWGGETFGGFVSQVEGVTDGTRQAVGLGLTL